MSHSHDRRGFTIATRQHVVAASPVAAVLRRASPLEEPAHAARGWLGVRSLVGSLVHDASSLAGSVISTVTTVAGNALGSLNVRDSALRRSGGKSELTDPFTLYRVSIPPSNQSHPLTLRLR